MHRHEKKLESRVRYSAAYPTGRELMLEPRYGCARAAGVGLPERSEPEGPQGAARERIAKGLLWGLTP